jgi:hypothetical protein
MVVPYKVDVSKVENTDTQVKKYMNELSKARSFQPPGALNDQIQYVKQPTPITQATVYNSLEGLVQEMKSKNASDTTINEIKDTLKSLKEESVKAEPDNYGDIHSELKVTVSALRETSESINMMISMMRKEAENAYINSKNDKKEDIQEAENLDTKSEMDDKEKFEDFDNYTAKSSVANESQQKRVANESQQKSVANESQQKTEDQRYTREEKVYKASENLAKKNNSYNETYHDPLSLKRATKIGLGRAIDDTLLPSNALFVATNLAKLENYGDNEASKLVASLSLLSKVRANGNKPIKKV